MSLKPEQIHIVNDCRHNIWPCFYGANWPELDPQNAVVLLQSASCGGWEEILHLGVWVWPRCSWGCSWKRDSTSLLCRRLEFDYEAYFLHHCLWRLEWCAAPAPVFLWVWNFHFMPTGAQNQEMWLTQRMFPHFSQHVNCQKYSFIISFEPAFVNGSFCQGG